MSESVLLPLLADGEFRSGQDLAEVLGISRTAVWKQMNKLSRETGVAIESVKGRGYRIAGGLDLLNSAVVEQAMQPAALAYLSNLNVVSAIDSTNLEAMRLAEQGAGSGLVVTAEQQSAGRGRRGRHWVSPYARNLYVSALWQFDQGAAALEGLSLAVGVAASHALQAIGVPPVSLKWPNDIVANGEKLGGILIEMSGDTSGACQVVIGIGINVAMPQASGEHIDQSWTDVSSLWTAKGSGQDVPTRNAILAALLSELLPLVANFESVGFAAWQDQWMTLDAFANVPVVIDSGTSQVAGVARGVDKRGALQLETTTGITSVYGGEISLRAAQ
ncbi:MAG: bifunctional biotin--[acetyl-CoA-carboxylase] ligase/biotin operon repressor BirA [Halioglobus sp.]